MKNQEEVYMRKFSNSKRIESEKGWKFELLTDTSLHKTRYLFLDVPRSNVVFDPRTLIPLDTVGTVYPEMKIIADRGIFEVKDGGCLFDWTRVIKDKFQ